MKLITHNGIFHCDEVTSTAVLSLLYNDDNFEIIRTRDADIINNTEDSIVYDVGGIYDPEKNRFDHHQKDFNEYRADGTKYSSAGLVWKQYGESIVESVWKKYYSFTMNNIIDVCKIADIIDIRYMSSIDAIDNGMMEKIPANLSSIVSLFNHEIPGRDNDENDRFTLAVSIVTLLFERAICYEIEKCISINKVVKLISESYGQLLIMDEFYHGWIEAVLDSDLPNAKNLLFGIFKTPDNKYGVRAIPPSKDNIMSQRRPFPEAWRGLVGKDLRDVSGVKSAVFCHVAGFYAVAETLEDAIRMASLASITNQ